MPIGFLYLYNFLYYATWCGQGEKIGQYKLRKDKRIKGRMGKEKKREKTKKDKLKRNAVHRNCKIWDGVLYFQPPDIVLDLA